MHGYFLSLKLYDTARLIANPFVYAEHREKIVKEKMEKMAETRIRASKNPNSRVAVNKKLAEKILMEEERGWKKEQKRKRSKQKDDVDAMDVGKAGSSGEEEVQEARSTLLDDPRFAKVFSDPAFEVDENSREYALLNPSAFTHRQQQRSQLARQKTAAEEEEDESDKISSDDLGGSESESESESEEENSEDSDDVGGMFPFQWAESLLMHVGLNKFDPRRRHVEADRTEQWQRIREPKVNFVPMRTNSLSASGTGKNATFGQRRSGSGALRMRASDVGVTSEGGMELSWVPSSQPDVPQRGKKQKRKRDTFGFGMEGGTEQPEKEMGNSERRGRTQRRRGVRSGSKNVFRKIDN